MESPLPDKVRKLYEVFKDVVERERQSQDIYRQAMELTDDPEIKTVLAKFIEEEARHERKVIEFYNRLRVQSGLDKGEGEKAPA